MNYFTDEKEWQWLFDNAIDWDKIIPLYYPEYPTQDGIQNKEELLGFFKELLTSTGEWAAGSVAGRARKLDEDGGGEVVDGSVICSETLLENYREAKELAFFGVGVDQKYGGMGLPAAVSLMGFTQVNRACISTATQIGFFTSIADMVERFCEPEDRERLLPMIINGDISGSMCLTEPDAGSDVGSLRTSAKHLNDKWYSLNGTKIFITNGGGGLGFVLGRIDGAPEGLKGISLFLVEEFLEEGGEKKRNYTVAKNEEKMGLHGSHTCEILYENSKGKLIGEPNQGMKMMFHLMNEARIAVGLQGLGGIEASLAYARKYAEEREQFGMCLMKLPLFRRNFEDWEAERDGFRALMVDTISFFDQYQRLDLKKRHHGLSDEERERFSFVQKVVRRRTPLVKLYGAETFTTLSQKAIQALGGHGFMKDHDVERLHRDSFAPLLYEGTTQIQSLMAMKDLLKYTMSQPTKFLQTMVGGHPIGNIFSGEGEYHKRFSGVLYEFRKNLMGLLMRCFKPDDGDITQVFSPKYWRNPKQYEKIMEHAETMAFSISYLETLKVLAVHADMDESRKELYDRYYRLVLPRFASIYCDWKNH
ncbi:MAG: hypothetical protein HOE90_09935 [Bacteriovoracaceae bacterium]|jgi:3-(methylthio)propanoyl-CoA dehydrogenase|nr:hypothetical protein [Bacteriovoracaceae bacterium]